MSFRVRRASTRAWRRGRDLRLAFVGFGGVGQRFAKLLLGPYGRILRKEGVSISVVGISTARHGSAVRASGLFLPDALERVRAGVSLQSMHKGPALRSQREFLGRVPAHVLIELTPLNPVDGEPGLSHVRAALSLGMHVVTANKGPVAFARRRLLRLAGRQGRRFLHESAVMDGQPIFNLAEHCLPGCRIEGFRGLLNSTTTRILTRMEQGVSFDAALRSAQKVGVAEAEPRNDIDGWDAALKACVLANALMGADVRPAQVQRRGIGRIKAVTVKAALKRNRRVRLIARAAREGRTVKVRVRPETLPADDVLVSRGADGVLLLKTDLMGEVGLWEGAGGVDQTAYGLLADLLTLIRDTN